MLLWFCTKTERSWDNVCTKTTLLLKENIMKRSCMKFKQICLSTEALVFNLFVEITVTVVKFKSPTTTLLICWLYMTFFSSKWPHQFRSLWLLLLFIDLFSSLTIWVFDYDMWLLLLQLLGFLLWIFDGKLFQQVSWDSVFLWYTDISSLIPCPGKNRILSIGAQLCAMRL